MTLKKLFRRLLENNYQVDVICKDDKKFTADIISIDFRYETMLVRFHSDDLTKPQSVRVEKNQHGFGYEAKEDWFYETKNMPIKEEHVCFSQIELPENTEPKIPKSKAVRKPEPPRPGWNAVWNEDDGLSVYDIGLR